MKVLTKIILFCLGIMFLYENSMANVFNYSTNNKIELIHDSLDSVEIKLELIRQAKHHVHLISYYLDNSDIPKRIINELKLAHQRGVEVRILTTFAPTLAKDLFLKTKTNLSMNDGGAVFSYLLLKPKNNILLLNNLHEKILLVDGRKAIIGGRNLSNNSIRAKDLEALLEGDVVKDIQSHFANLFNFVAKMEMENCKKGDDVCLLNLESQLIANDDLNYFPVIEQVGNVKMRLLSHNAVLEQIQNKYKYADRIKMRDDIIDTVISTSFSKMRAYNYFILPTKRYEEFLLANAEAKKDIKIITNSFKSSAFVTNKGYIYSLPKIQLLLNHGIDIYQWQISKQYEYLHEKVIVFDDDHVFLGSHNFGVGSTAVSNEIAIEFYSKEIAGSLIKIFDDELKDESKTKAATDYSLNSELLSNLKMIKILNKTSLGEVLEEGF